MALNLLLMVNDKFSFEKYFKYFDKYITNLFQTGFTNIDAKNNASRKALKYFCIYDTEERKIFRTLPLEFGNQIEE